MNLWQRTRGNRQRMNLPAGFDTLDYLYRLSARPMNGQLEVADGNLDSIVERIYKQSGPVFALIAIRMLLFSEARFLWQHMNQGRPADLFWTQDLKILEHPYGPTSTLGDMLKRAEQDVSTLGNSFITDRNPGRLKRLRPDWVTIVYGSESDPDFYGDAIDGELLGYIYTPRMPGGSWGEGTVLLPDEVSHYAPYPDPQTHGRGMSWITPVLREIQSDESALIHKESFFRNGAGPRLAMKLDPSIEKTDFERFAATIEAHHTGPWNAYKTLYLAGGADPVPMTFNLRDLDYKNVIGGGETRLASVAGVPPTIVGFSEGLAGSALNEGNYKQSKRRLGDATLRPLWRDFAGSLESILTPPDPGSRMWYDDRDIAFLRDDESDSAEIVAQRATTLRQLVDAGFEPDAATKAVQSGDLASLVGKHTGLFSVQLQPLGNGDMSDDKTLPADPNTPPGNEPPAPAPGDGKTA